ncbi:Daunorubicin/doxorubicin resistance ATP-binding protein DrrA [Nonomuraea coxensis DSM 45129]|uniref:Daunorubicin/doxorubicin resistance ATP-binding protein DrrA n=1 Tax=Nonomuraea coxensis DSM 45129 TaxID=1122611 RepID=A0ABX8U7N5_9ACTN|nr:alpha/beta fold hydrolase [Nonomuraea coxensis]QYC43703.1 Daunorubicin/doxorubicin resistance ATP-binding protein DrrA [Nonomuraea coxensis DSM 45129]
MKRVAALVAALALIGVTTWLVWPSAPQARGQDQAISVVDGPDDDQQVHLDTTFFPPADGGKAPVVLLAHGFGGSKQSVRQQAERLAQDGYAVLTWSARGFGRSTGQIALNSPDYEVKDVKQLIDWVAKRPEVQLDAAGDPRVGIVGGSYGGAIALMTAAFDQRVDAIVPQITWADLADALFPNNAAQSTDAGAQATSGGLGDPESGVFKRMWSGIFFGRGLSLESFAQQSQTQGQNSQGQNGQGQNAQGQNGQGQGGQARGQGFGQGAAPMTPEEARCGRFLPAICDIYQTVAKNGRATAEAVTLLRASSPITVANRIKAPTLLLQGQRDSLFPLSHADANAKAIASAGTPVSIAWFDGGHDGGNGEADWLYEQTSAWLARYLKGEGAAQATPPVSGFTVTRDGGRDPGTRQRIRLHPEASAYPGLGGTDTTTVQLTGPEQNVVNPPGGAPAAISTVPGVGALLGGQSGGVSLDMPGQSAVFESAPLTAPLQLTGSSTASVKVTGEGEATLFAKVYDVSDGSQLPVLPAGQVAPFRVTFPDGGGSVQVRVALPAADHSFAAGHRLRLVVATTDMGFATPAEPAAYQVALASPGLTVPTVRTLSAPPAGIAWWVWAMPLTAIVIAAALLATGRTSSRRTTAPTPSPSTPEPDTDDGRPVPLEIKGLTKAYRNGELAVDGLSFRVERGQVLGLLGPNGAGKTTTMRMMMGLIRPDDGEVRIFGERVTPGAPVLSRLGSFVEGPGFLPHLSGRDNIELYWAATGRPPADAHFEEALEIAGLGKALERAVRTYSQGMRQRLAIAQAMLGLPDLLVLDEPTNGLDPPQIREMREVLKRYARDGRTVIVSSHLLAEVEQTCSHVVVMHRGRLVSAGPVSRLLTSAKPANGHGPRLEDVFLDLIGDKP